MDEGETANENNCKDVITWGLCIASGLVMYQLNRGPETDIRHSHSLQLSIEAMHDEHRLKSSYGTSLTISPPYYP